jgi:hypothetical protein
LRFGRQFSAWGPAPGAPPGYTSCASRLYLGARRCARRDSLSRIDISAADSDTSHYSAYFGPLTRQIAAWIGAIHKVDLGNSLSIVYDRIRSYTTGRWGSCRPGEAATWPSVCSIRSSVVLEANFQRREERGARGEGPWAARCSDRLRLQLRHQLLLLNRRQRALRPHGLQPSGRPAVPGDGRGDRRVGGRGGGRGGRGD